LNVLSVIEIRKSYGETRALAGVTFDVGEGEIVSVLGPSGCGKSTLLAVIAGLEPPDSGDIHWRGRSLADRPPHERGFGLMFQDYALFPHLNVFRNVAFGLRWEGLSIDEVRRRATDALSLVGLPDFGMREVDSLSGGEQQRVALARALAPRPRLLMLDEPLGSLDRTLRDRLLAELPRILRGPDGSAPQTTIYVTHDQEEAFSLADRVVLMNAGEVVQIGEPQAIYARPASVFVARFLGLTNLIAAGPAGGGQPGAETALGRLPLREVLSGPATLLIRPDSARLDGQGATVLEGEVAQKTFRGGLTRLDVVAHGIRMRFDFPSGTDLPGPGGRIRIGLPPEAIQVLP
jgi:ABC-type Fe3+/spermidine/putrescine transport system ATPase subunit